MTTRTANQIVSFVTGPTATGKSGYLADVRDQAEASGRSTVQIVVTAISMPQLVHELHFAPRDAVITIDDAEMGVWLTAREVAEIALRHTRGRHDLTAYIAAEQHPLAPEPTDSTF